MKIAVYSEYSNVDPVGACVGASGVRVSNVLKEINGEKIDIIPWDKEIQSFITNSLSPAKVINITINEEDKLHRWCSRRSTISCYW